MQLCYPHQPILEEKMCMSAIMHWRRLKTIRVEIPTATEVPAVPLTDAREFVLERLNAAETLLQPWRNVFFWLFVSIRIIVIVLAAMVAAQEGLPEGLQHPWVTPWFGIMIAALT